MKKLKFIGAGVLSLAMAVGISAAIIGSKSLKKAEAYYSPSTTYNVSDTAEELTSYYSSISDSDTGTSLLSKLQSLNSSKRKKTIGYSGIGTDTSGAVIYTDYDLNSTAKDSNGQTYGTKVASFYTKTAATGWNREHMWPNSHGGNNVEADILHTRPTISSENSSRGNSFYVEGKNSSSAGWDPYTAGYDAEVRGECARVILYCVVAYPSFTLSDADSHSTSNSNKDNMMGNMNTLIKWHFDYSPNVYEMNRNNGAEYLQGNRNPFVDHPEYVARIWSSFNSTVSSLCSTNASMYDNWVPGSYSNYGENNAVNEGGVAISKTSETINVGSTTTLSATSTDSSTITWSTSNSSVASINKTSASSGSSITVTGVSAGTATITAKATVDGTQYTKTCTITVTKVVDSLSVSGTLSKTSYTAGDHFDPTGLSVTAHYSDTTTGNVTSSVTWSPDPLTAGTTTVTASYGGKTVDFEGITVEAKQTSDFTFVNTDFGSYDKTAATFTKDGMSFTRYYVMDQSSTIQFKSGQGYIYNNDSLNLSSITINGLSGSLTVYGGTSKNPSSTAITGSNGQYDLTGYTYFKIVNSSSSVANATSITVELANASTKSLSSIAVSNETTSYTVGDTFVKPTVTATYSDSTTADVTSSATFSGYNMSTAGSQTVTVSYTEDGVTKTTTYSITVNPAATLSTIYITGTLGKSTYYEGDSFDPTGLTVTAQYSDNSTADVTSSVTWTPDPLTAGTTTVTASYGGKTTTLNGVTVNALVLSSISLSGQTTEYNLNDSFSFTGTCTAHYNSGSTKSVTPTSVSSPDMTSTGNKTVTVSYTEGGVSKTANYTITVTETPFVNSIEQCYSKSSGASVSNVYGLYVGSFNNGESSVIMNGEFGILLYKKAPDSSWVENQTYLCVTSASVSIYKNLYELASCTVSVEDDSSVISQNIRPISTYTVTGNESSSDLTVANRLCLMSGVVTSITSSSTSGFTANKDNTVMMNVGGKSVQLFVKSGTATSEVGSVLTESLNSSSEITVKGYTGFHTSFQVQFKSLLEASSTYSAEDFASDVLSLTDSICASSSNKESDLSGVWLTLELDKWSILASDQKTILINASASQSGTTIQQGMARYDRICTKYASCTNFIGRSSANAANINKGIISNSNTALVVMLISTITITSVGAYFFLKKKKKHN